MNKSQILAKKALLKQDSSLAKKALSQQLFNTHKNAARFLTESIFDEFCHPNGLKNVINFIQKSCLQMSRVPNVNDDDARQWLNLYHDIGKLNDKYENLNDYDPNAPDIY